MADFSEKVEGPLGYDFEPTMSEEQYQMMAASRVLASKATEQHEGTGSSDDEPELEEDRIGNTAWCQCGLCEAMESRVESVCCTEIGKLEEKVMGTCITLHRNFDSICLNEDVLSATWNLLQHTKGNQPSENLQNRQYRFVAYKMFTQWGHGHMGRGNRTPIPSCAVYQIRLKFPEPDAEYTGFSYADEVLADAMPM
ncbi:P2X purinoceptor 7 [Holothuria leucospilota]|uniref:P2X purinoceptor 7 n=1 Tax=Holothuria leucospilota TaxID=206669 RepID=A0A9Q1HLD5_HOLLE|nr:P2X purinoceptor 7 [Holothuria leucospilota]